MMRSRARSRGLTLLELLIVIGVIAILGTMLMVGITTARRTAWQVACMNNLKQIYQMSMDFAGDHDGALPQLEQPDGTPWHVTLQTYRNQNEGVDDVFVCPAHGGGYRPDDIGWTNDNMSYGLNADVKLADGTPRSVDTAWPTRGGKPEDLDHDRYTLSEIELPSEFILVGESSERANRYAVGAARRGQDGSIGMWHPDDPKAGKGHVLFASGSVELRGPEVNGTSDTATSLWTLPAD